MTAWQQVAESHLRCRLTFAENVGKLRCHDHDVTLLLPLRSEQAVTSGPPPFKRPDNPALRPMPSGLKERVAAEIAARKLARQPLPPEPVPS